MNKFTESERAIWGIHANIVTDIITIAGAAVHVVVSCFQKNNAVDTSVVVIFYLTFIAVLLGIISSAVSTAEETTGFYAISRWWVGLIAWGVG
jgi:hypothetical protein